MTALDFTRFIVATDDQRDRRSRETRGVDLAELDDDRQGERPPAVE
ncbi:hypothetical protein [Streptomyces malaysiensis]